MSITAALPTIPTKSHDYLFFSAVRTLTTYFLRNSPICDMQWNIRSSHHSSVATNLPSIHEDAGLIPGLAQWVKDMALLWLLRRPATIALNRPLAWEPPYAVGAALKKTKKKKIQLNIIQPWERMKSCPLQHHRWSQRTYFKVK